LACCDTRFYWGSRSRAMILILLDTGVRRTELVNLDLAVVAAYRIGHQGGSLFHHHCQLKRCSSRLAFTHES
jgi:integrase